MSPTTIFLSFKCGITCSILTVLFGMMLAGCANKVTPPGTPTKSVFETYHGMQVEDPYRWLADFNDPAVRKWNEDQNAYSRSYFDHLDILPPVQKQVRDILEQEATAYYSVVWRGRLFAMKMQPPKNQPMIVEFLGGPDTTGERVIVDPNVLNPSGTTTIDWYVPSHDGRIVAVSLSEKGSEDGTLHLFDGETGKPLEDTVPRVQYATAGGSVEWNAANSGFFYTRYPQGNERAGADINFYQQIYFHKLGTPASQDVYVLGKEFPRIAEIALSSSSDGRYILASVANGDGGEFAHYLLSPSGTWKQITQFSDKIVAVRFGMDNRLYLLSRATSPMGTILTVPVENPSLVKASTVVPAGIGSIKEFVVTEHAMYVVDIVGGPSRLRLFDVKGKPLAAPNLDSVARIGALCIIGGDRVLFGLQSYLKPITRYEHDPSWAEARRTNLSSVRTIDFSDCEVVREVATSKDGTKVPMSIIQRKGTTRDGLNPVVLYGYGGYGYNEEPAYDPLLRVWLDQKGIYVVANIRGGGEFGEEWHKQGMLTKKQNCFDDFLACAHHLIDLKYTSREKLAIEGGSNGGLLMGAALTQEPDLFRAVVSFVGIYDMLQVERFPNGQFNVTEYGSVKDSTQFAALYAYSPYQHVRKGVAYPATLLLTGDNDGRVDPANSRKMIAILQAATSSDRPLLLRTDAQAGHGIGTGLNDRAAQEADVYAFLFDQLGVAYRQAR